MPQLHLIRASHDLFVYDFRYDFSGIVGGSKLRRMRFAFFIDHELLKVLPPGGFCGLFSSKAQHLTSFLQHVGHLAVGAFGCKSIINKLPLNF